MGKVARPERALAPSKACTKMHNEIRLPLRSKASLATSRWGGRPRPRATPWSRCWPIGQVCTKLHKSKPKSQLPNEPTAALKLLVSKRLCGARFSLRLTDREVCPTGMHKNAQTQTRTEVSEAVPLPMLRYRRGGRPGRAVGPSQSVHKNAQKGEPKSPLPNEPIMPPNNSKTNSYLPAARSLTDTGTSKARWRSSLRRLPSCALPGARAGPRPLWRRGRGRPG